MKAILILLTIMAAGAASAECRKYGNTTQCDNGNTYTTFGNTTFGSNYRTGTSWSQTTTGNTTIGSSSDGGFWSKTETDRGAFGSDANGKPFNCFKDFQGKLTCY
jgi:hypothetical protein